MADKADWAGRWARYMAHPDPFARATNRVAFLVAASQLFYPLYLAATAGAQGGLGGMVAWVTTPLFLAVPLANRRDPEHGLLLLIVAGTLVTLLAALTLGTASLAEAYDAPVLLAALLLRARPMVLACVIPAGVFLLSHVAFSQKGLFADASVAAGLAPVHLLGAAGLSLYLFWQAHLARRG